MDISFYLSIYPVYIALAYLVVVVPIALYALPLPGQLAAQATTTIPLLCYLSTNISISISEQKEHRLSEARRQCSFSKSENSSGIISPTTATGFQKGLGFQKRQPTTTIVPVYRQRTSISIKNITATYRLSIIVRCNEHCRNAIAASDPRRTKL
jgi:hypothetical protein